MKELTTGTMTFRRNDMEAILEVKKEGEHIDIELENTEILELCPFCGSEGEIVHTWTPHYSIRCIGCEAEVGDPESWSENTEETHLESAKRAIAAWNRRDGV